MKTNGTLPGQEEKDEYPPVEQETAGDDCVRLNVAAVPPEACVLVEGVF